MRQRLEAVSRSLERRAILPLAAWRGMLETVGRAPPEAMVDWLEIQRIEGRDVDVALNRHWVDPTRPLRR
jgi:ATP-dependent DNA helicase DinG